MNALYFALLLLAVKGESSSRKKFDPKLFLKDLPSLRLPYQDSVPMPTQRFLIKPSPAVTITSVMTHYVTRNPICIKIPKLKKRPMCGHQGPVGNWHGKLRKRKTKLLYPEPLSFSVDFGENSFALQGSEKFYDMLKPSKTPELEHHVLETVLHQHHYNKGQQYHTQYITVSKTLEGGGETATLLVRNCIPEGVQMCSKKGEH